MTNDMANLEITSEYLKVLAHPLRLKIIHILLNNHFSVGELAGACEISSQVISTHLRKLNDRGILKKHRNGQKVFYQVVEPVYQNIINSLAA